MSAVARKLQQDRRRRGVTLRPRTILAVATDDHGVVCMTEATLDAWWASLPAEEKAEIWEEELDRHEPNIAYSAEAAVPPAWVKSREGEASFLREWTALNRAPLDATGKPVTSAVRKTMASFGKIALRHRAPLGMAGKLGLP